MRCTSELASGRGRHSLLSLALVFSALSSAQVSAAPDWSKDRYNLQVVLHLGKHRQLTEVFRDRLRRDLEDSLREALGELAQVEVKTAHQRMPEVLAKGLQQALDDWKERSPDGVKTHFVLVDYVGDQFVIQARQHDGFTGLPSPVVRIDRTRDRDFVAKAGAELIALDFGFRGMVQLPADPKATRVDLQGAALGVPLGRWVKTGDVFAVVQMPVGPESGRLLPFTVLQVRTALSEWRLWQPSEVPLHKRADGPGYCCVKLGAGTWPIRLRVLEAGKGLPEPAEAGLPVHVRRSGFDGPEEKLDRKQINETGSFDTLTEPGYKGLFDRIAFISIGRDPRLFKVPLALVADREVEIRIANAGDGLEPLRFRRDSWARNVRDSYLVQTNLFREINDLSTKAKQRSEAINRAKLALERSRDDLKRLDVERGELLAEINKLPPDARPNWSLAESEQRLKDLQEGERQLSEFLIKLEKIDKDESDPRRKAWLEEIERARLLESKAELGQALAIYEKLIGEGLDTADIKKKVDDLKKLWTPVDAEHRQARRFIYEEFPKLDTKGLKEQMEEARKSFAVCKKHKDLVGPKKLLDEAVRHGERLKEELEKLNPINVDEEMQIALIKELNKELGSLSQEIDDYLRKAAGR